MTSTRLKRMKIFPGPRDEDYVHWGVRVRRRRDSIKVVAWLAAEAAQLLPDKRFEFEAANGIRITSVDQHAEWHLFAEVPMAGAGRINFNLLKELPPKPIRAKVMAALGRFCFELGVKLRDIEKKLSWYGGRLTSSVHVMGGLK